MKKKKNHKFIVLIILAVILLILIIPFIKMHDRIDIIEKNDLKFNIISFFSEKPMPADSSSQIELINFTDTMQIACNNPESLKIELENRDKVAREIEFVIKNKGNLNFYFPPKLMLPPESRKEFTFFLDIGCEDKGKTINSVFQIKNTDLSFPLAVLIN